MKNKSIKNKLTMFLALLIVLGSFGCAKEKTSSQKEETNANANASTTDSTIDTSFDDSDLDVSYDESNSTTVTLNGTSADISGSGAEFSEGNLVISKAGTYILSGTISDGQLIVNADKKSDIKLIFKGLDITCSDNAGVFINKADKVTITLENITENSITDAAEYSLDEDSANVDGAIFSRCDLIFNGTGSLNVTANYKHGIVCKDDLVITEGTYIINSVSGGLYGKDSVKINNGTFNITCGSNGIKSSNTEDAEKGFIYVNGGDFTINSTNDGLEASTVLSIESGEFNITTGGGSVNASMNSNNQPNDDWGQWQGGMEMGGGPGGGPNQQSNNAQNAGTNNNNGQFEDVAYTQTNSTTEDATTSDNDTESTSAKGLKAGNEINIKGGNFTIDSSDDSIHSNGNINISNGTINAQSGDDGVHADSDLSITGGTINIDKSYEGLEGMTINISGGQTSIVSSDDGVNAGGGSDTGSSNRPGMDNFNTSSDNEYLLTISGGVVNINASGDGLDSNGNLIIEGGEVYVSGPTNDGNGAIDYGDNGSSWITGGVIVACGSTGMAETFGADNSTQYSVLRNLSSTVSGGTNIVVTDSSGKTIISYTPAKDFQSVVFSSSDIKNGETYTITAGSVSETVTVDSISTSNGSSGGRMGGGGGRR